MTATQVRARARAAESRSPPSASRQDRTAIHGQAAVLLAWWRRLCPSSFVLAGVTVLILWVAVTELLRQGRLETVLSAGRAELAAPGTALRIETPDGTAAGRTASLPFLDPAKKVPVS